MVDFGPWHEERTKRFLTIRERYTDAEFKRFDAMSKCIVESLTENFKDCLGDIFMELELGNHWRGQFFTPYHVSLLMAKITHPDPPNCLNKHGIIDLNDPCCGAGAMLIATAQHLIESGVNYQQHLHITAQDIDETAVHMTYIQLSLLYVPATVICGNSLNPSNSQPVWYTVAHVRDNWGMRLRRADSIDAMLALMRAPEQPEPVTTPVRPATEQTFEMMRQRRNDLIKKYRDSGQMGLF